jgi:hypothetical protein
MKMQMLPLLAGLCLLAGCGTTQPGYSMEDATSIRIECKKDKILQTVVMQRLRSAHARDITVDDQGAELEIEASFRVADVPPDGVYEIEDDFLQLPGVIYVHVEKSHTVIRQTGFF